MATQTQEIGTRQRLINAMQDLLQRKGFHGIGLSDVLAQAQAPKGVLYHHFPGGKVELAVVAIQSAVNNIISKLEQLRAMNESPLQVLSIWLDLAQKKLIKSGFQQGCPLATVALESTAEDRALRKTLDEGFNTIRSALAEMLAEAGMTTERASRFSTLIVSAYEGALLQSRVADSAKPAGDTLDLLLQLIQLEIDPSEKRSCK